MRTGILVCAAIAALAPCALGGCSGDGSDPGTVDGDADSDADGGADTETFTDADDDNDGDGLSNGLEEEIGTDPNLLDSDGDGFSDFIEWVAGTDALDPGSTPLAAGDFVFVAPYSWDPAPAFAVLSFSTADAPTDLATLLRDDDSDDEDAAALIERVSAIAEGGAADPMNPDLICASGLGTADDDEDSIPDRFVDVPPDTLACFEIVPAKNESIPASSAPKVFKAFLDVVGDGAAVLDTRTIYFYIPN